MKYSPLVILFAWLAAGVHAQSPAPFMMHTHVGGEALEGQPLTWTDDQMVLMGRDGQIYEFAPKHAQKSKKTASQFRGYSIMEMRDRLRQEFSKDFDVSYTQHFVVVHPRGAWSVWADRLEALYRSFTHYMSVRGFRLDEPRVPLVAIVFRNEAEYYRYAQDSGTPMQPNTLGHYSSGTNRIYLFDEGLEKGKDWAASNDTIIHEATHQTASIVVDSTIFVICWPIVRRMRYTNWSPRTKTSTAMRPRRTPRLGRSRFFSAKLGPKNIVITWKEWARARRSASMRPSSA